MEKLTSNWVIVNTCLLVCERKKSKKVKKNLGMVWTNPTLNPAFRLKMGLKSAHLGVEVSRKLG